MDSWVRSSVVFVCIVAAAVLVGAQAYRPVVLMHGLMASQEKWDDVADWIEENHPGTLIWRVECYPDARSLAAIWKQVACMTASLREFHKQINDTTTYHVIGSSQGGIVSRSTLQSMDDHRAHSFMTYSSPLLGQFGETSFLAPYIPAKDRLYVWHLFYTKEFQKTNSVANYWNDPFHTKEYLAENILLPYINNEVEHADSARYKANFERIQQFVQIGGPQDGVITPWQSAHWGFYTEGSVDEVTPMTKQATFANDSFGLRSADKAQRIHMYTYENIAHEQWVHTKKVFMEAVLPHLD